MKKTYIAPAIMNHKIAIETDILVISRTAIFGNKKVWNQEQKKYEGYVVPYVEDEGWGIDPIEGDDWSTL